MTSADGCIKIDRREVQSMTDIWEFANPQAIALGVGVAVLLSALSLESIVLWKATHQSQ